MPAQRKGITMKILKAALISVIISVLVIAIEPIRIFAGMVSLAIPVMIIADSIKAYRKTQREKVKVKRK